MVKEKKQAAKVRAVVSGKLVATDELAELRRALEEIEKLRFVAGISSEEAVRLESASVDLREREREIIASLGEEVAGQIKSSSISLEKLSKRIKTRNQKLSRFPKSMDKISEVILEIIDIAGRVGREL
ncbi:MAG: hypothetical protein WCX48_03475 [Bacteroidales bacterium]